MIKLCYYYKVIELKLSYSDKVKFFRLVNLS